MGTEKKENRFEVAIYLNGNKLMNKYFSADDYSPKVRNLVNIRHLSNDIFETIKNELIAQSGTKDKRESWLEYTLSLNDNYISGKKGKVEMYNNRVKYSLETVGLIEYITEMIKADLKKKDFDYLYNQFEVSERAKLMV